MATKSKSNGKTPSKNLFWVVGVGASAGGLEAFKQFVKAIPVDSGMAYILVQHLDPTHDSILVELLQKNTLIPIHEIVDNVEVEPDNIYVIPSKKLLTADDGILNLTERTSKSQAIAIDVFFKSLADVHQTQAIGVVLSGTGKDGTAGLKWIKEKGGITFAQSPQTAAYAEMPQSAINAGVVDFTLATDEIVYHLLELDKSKNTDEDDKENEEKPEDAFFKKIIDLVYIQKSVDFTYYKQTTIRRRIMRGMVSKKLRNVEDFYNLIKEKPAEIDILFEDILIPVTDFFRDSKTFDSLYETAFPAILKSKAASEPLRIWVAGCSTGQEAYSMAICLSEYVEKHKINIKIQIFATDISEKSIVKARTAIYKPEELKNISPARMEKNFTKVDGGNFQINKSVRDSCVFANHNFLSDPPFAHIDIVSCRNVLIYMDTFLQRKAMAGFHYALQPNGLLILGNSESLGKSSDLFKSFRDFDKLYSRKPVPGRFIQIATRRKEAILKSDIPKLLKDIRPSDDFQKNADDIILAKAPAGVVVNEQLEIVQFRGSTGEWLEPSPGKPSLNVLKMAKHGLALELRSAIYKAKSTQQSFTKEGITVLGKGVKKITTLEVIPIPNTINIYYLILFTNTAEIPDKQSLKPSSAKGKKSAIQARALELEKELFQIREDMRTITEDQETANGELLGVNEELMSNSEELRSLNEELEISKEELQSTVEELSVSNQELAFRNEELNHSRQYAEAIVTTIREPLIVLDRDLRVKSANSSFYKTFGRTEQETEGKLFYELGERQWNIPALRNLLERILREKTFYDSYELKRRVSSWGERVLILNARKIVNGSNNEQLILLAIEDVTERRNIDEQIKKNADYIKSILESSPQMVSTASADGSVTYFNQFFLTYTGLALNEAIAWGWQRVVPTEMLEEVTRNWLHSVTTGNEFSMELKFRRHDGMFRWHIWRALPIRDQKGLITSWVATASDIHDQKMFAQELERSVRERTQSLKEANIELEHSNKNLEQFAFIASHDLQEPLRKIKTFSTLLVDEYSTHLPDEGKRMLQKIHRSSERMSTLIQDVLNFSRIENSKNVFVKTDLNYILNDVLNDFSLLISESKAVVNHQPLPTLEVIHVQINQLFYNLLSNALKFARSGTPPVIDITSRKLTSVEVALQSELNPGQEYCEIVFKDNGIGFSEEYKEQIFLIFQRLHSKEQYPGTGIGLALCKKIVVNHRGIIYAESKLKEGATFHIVLPYEQHVVLN